MSPLEAAGHLIDTALGVAVLAALAVALVIVAVVAYDAITSARVDAAREKFWAGRRRKLPTPPLKVVSRRVRAVEQATERTAEPVLER